MGSLTKALIGKEDCDIQTNANATETFNRLTSTGSTIALEKFPDIWDGTGLVNAAKVITSANPLHYGATGDGIVDDTSYLQACIDGAEVGETLVFDDDYLVTAGLTITDKTDLTITGSGILTLQTGSTTAVRLFDFVGTCSNVTIENLNLVGEANTSYYQTAIGEASGQTLTQLTFRNLKVSDFNVGISLNANTSGTITNCKVYGNHVSNIVGTGTGQGYGIHLANAMKTVVHHNTITDCQRHSIYQARGVDCGNIISENIITDHRETGNTGTSFLAAIVVGRSSHVQVINNVLIDFYDGGILVSPSTSDSISTTHITVKGNRLFGRKNVIPGIIVGEQGVPTSYFAQYIDITDNEIYTDRTSITGNDIRLVNGKNIRFNNNYIVNDNVAAAHSIIAVGIADYIAAATDFDYIEVNNNRIDVSGTDLTTFNAVYIDTDVVATYAPHVEIIRNRVNGVAPGAREIGYGTTPSNPNLSFVGMRDCYVLELGAGLAAGGTNRCAKTTVNVNFKWAHFLGGRNAADDVWTIGATANTGAGEFRKVLLCIDNSNDAQYVVGEVAAAQASAAVPRCPSHLWTPFGVVEINASWTAGDALTGTFYDLIGPLGN